MPCEIDLYWVLHDQPLEVFCKKKAALKILANLTGKHLRRNLF